MDYAALKKAMSEQKVELTTAERNTLYAQGKEVDFQPYRFQGGEPALGWIFGFHPTELGNFEIKKEVIRRSAEEFGVEGITAGLGLRTIGRALGSTVKYRSDGMDYIDEFALEDYDKLDSMDVLDPYTNPMLAPILEKAKRLKDAFPDYPLATSFTGPLSNAIAVRPVEKVLRDTVKNKDRLHQLMRLITDSSVEWIRVFQKEFGTAGARLSDPACCSNMISKKQFNTFSYPYMKALTDATYDMLHTKTGAHICGNTKFIWEDLKGLTISALSIDNCEDLAEAKAILGDTMSIGGNVPPVDVMLNGTIDDVIESVKTCIIKAADSPCGFTLNLGCQLPCGTPRENVEAFIYAARKYGRGAQKGKMPKGILEEL